LRLREFSLARQAPHLAHRWLLAGLGQALDRDVATAAQHAHRHGEQPVAEPADELADPLVAGLAGLVCAQGFLAAQTSARCVRFISGSASSWASTSVARVAS
jgi:hypothetical protein